MVSVIIPTYNRERTIVRAVESVLEQSYRDLEVLIVDDGSEDGTRKLLEKIEDERLHYLLLEENGGPSRARNAGVHHAKGEWIAFQDSDDVWREDKLEQQLRYAAKHPEYSMIYGYCLVHREGETALRAPLEPFPEVMEGDMLSTLLVRNVIAAPTMMMKRMCFLETGGFKTDYHANEDWDFVIRFSKQFLIGLLPEIVIDVYMQKDGVSSRIGEYYESRCRILAENRKELMELGLFDRVAMDILERAKGSGIQETVKKMMMLFLQRY